MNEGTELWDAVAVCIDAYLSAAGPSEALPSIEDFLPSASKEIRSLALIELAKLEMEQLAGRNMEFGVDAYLARYPELRECTGGAPLDLIIDEIRLRKLSGNCDERAFLDRFPYHRESLKRYFSFSDTTPSATASSLWNRTQIQAGQSIDDYDLVRLLGSGAFAQVFLARQNTMQRLVALKVSADRGDEAKTLAQLDHPHIVRVYDVRRQPQLHLRLLSMQYAPGGTLHDVILHAKTIPWKMLNGHVIVEVVDQHLLSAGLPPLEESPRRLKLSKSTWVEAVCDIGIQLASALEYAHREQVLHRDVKPANVLLTSEASCKLADFNISFSGELIGANPSSYFGGSLIYMSPEQLEATRLDSSLKPSDLDERSDVFSLGFVIWELLTVARPWVRDQAELEWQKMVEQVSIRRKTEEPTLNPQVIMTPALERVIGILKRALRADRDERISSAGELGSQLRLCMSPQAWRLFHPESSGLSGFALKSPILLAALVVFIPNGLAGAFNFFYNYAWITEKAPESKWDFIGISLLVNFISFSLGGWIFWSILSPIAKEVKNRFGKRNRENSPLLREAFALGHRTATNGVFLWLAAGLLFPILLAMRVPEFDLTNAIHFFLSLAVCGAIAGAYPFLGMSLVVVEVWFGQLIGLKLHDDGFRARADQLIRRCDRYLLAASGVPLAGLVLLLGQNELARIYLLLLVLASGMGLFLAFRVHSRLRRMVGTLSEVVEHHRS